MAAHAGGLRRSAAGRSVGRRGGAAASVLRRRRDSRHCRVALRVGRSCTWARRAEAVSAPGLALACRCCISARTPSPTRAIPTGRASCSRRRRPGGPADYLFLREIYDLDLTGVQLVTLSACDTERGKVIRGEGVEGFSRALLAAGAASAVTTMWDVVDRASAEFMKQFYFALARGRVGSVGAATGEAAVPALRARVVASALLGRVRAERRRPRTASARVVPWSADRRCAVSSRALLARRAARHVSSRSGGAAGNASTGSRASPSMPPRHTADRTPGSATMRSPAPTRRAAAPRRRTARTIRAPADSRPRAIALTECRSVPSAAMQAPASRWRW